MNILKTSAIALMMGALPVAVQAQQMPAGANHMPRPMGGGMQAPKPSMPNVGGPRNWGPRHNGRWQMGYRAPGGWGGYRRPFVGYALPSFWINPSFYVGNYGNYGFSRPSNGYGWSRYYNDAVMTDRYGRVQDYIVMIATTMLPIPKIIATLMGIAMTATGAMTAAHLSAHGDVIGTVALAGPSLAEQLVPLQGARLPVAVTAQLAR
jgi:hypothetical protein